MLKLKEKERGRSLVYLTMSTTGYIYTYLSTIQHMTHLTIYTLLKQTYMVLTDIKTRNILNRIQ